MYLSTIDTLGLSEAYSRRKWNIQNAVRMPIQLVLQGATPRIIKSNTPIQASSIEKGTVLNPHQLSDAWVLL
jgi:hypothetical protein